MRGIRERWAQQHTTELSPVYCMPGDLLHPLLKFTSRLAIQRTKDLHPLNACPFLLLFRFHLHLGYIVLKAMIQNIRCRATSHYVRLPQ